jgi:hypothetical protein
MQKGCQEMPSDEAIKGILSEVLYNKYLKFKLNKTILNSKDMKFCPIVNCDGYARKELSSDVECTNKHKFCFDCLNPWHPKKNCQEIIDIEFEKWRKGKLIKKCVHCGFWTEKNAGCNHMTCKACKMEWCWICGQAFVSGHYGPGGSCYNLQYSKYNYNIDNRRIYHNGCIRFMYRVLRRLGSCVLFVLLFIALLLVGSSIVAVYYCDKKTDGNLGTKTKFVVYAFIFILAIVFQPIFLAVFVAFICLLMISTVICYPLAKAVIRQIRNLVD